jgi:hypothetical protein
MFVWGACHGSGSLLQIPTCRFQAHSCVVADRFLYIDAMVLRNGPTVQGRERRCLGSKGLAIALHPAEAVLEPFSEVWCRISCINDMVGEYLDHLHCAVGSQDPVVFAVRAGVVGSPVHVQAERTLIQGLHERVCAEGRLDFGNVPQNVPHVKSFSVFSTSSFRVDVAFYVRVFEKDPQQKPCSVCLRRQADGKVAVLIRYASTTAVTHVACCCYTDEPQGLHTPVVVVMTDTHVAKRRAYLHLVVYGMLVQ